MGRYLLHTRTHRGARMVSDVFGQRHKTSASVIWSGIVFQLVCSAGRALGSARLASMAAIRWLGAIAGVLAAATAVPATGSAQTLRVGSVTMHRCPAQRRGWCGSIRRALDPGVRDSPMIRIAFEWLPASRRRRSLGTIVAVEGGPGFPSTGSFTEYHGIFGPLLRARNLLLVDNRGTGHSALIRCRMLDSYPQRARASGPPFARVVGACGRSLNRRYRTRRGTRIQASDLFATAYAVPDLRAVLAKLGLRRVDLYGDSYGSWFVQAFMARFPGVLRSVILDSTYAIRGLDPYYGSSGSSGRAALDRVCQRDPGCVAAAGVGSATTRLGELIARVRRRPLRGTAPGRHGRRVPVTIDPRHLVDLFQDSGSDPLVLRDFDAAVRAALRGDRLPLLRLVAYDSSTNGGSPHPAFFSDGDYMAVGCTDYPQLFSLRASPAVRRRQLRASVRAAPAGVFAPFTTREWVTMSGYSETYDTCLDWPLPRHHAPVLPVRTRPLPASVPVLVLGGDLDDLTPLSDAERFAPTLGQRVRVIDLHNTVHVTSEGDTYLSDGARCARAIIRRFITTPARLARLDARCAARIPHIHTPGSYPLTFRAAPAAALVSGPAPGLQARRAVTVAARAFADATMQRAASGARTGLGLRGGFFMVKGHRLWQFRLHRIRFVRDALVDGTGTYRVSDGAVRATLTVAVGRRRYVVRVAWNQASLCARAKVGKAVLRLPAP